MELVRIRYVHDNIWAELCGFVRWPVPAPSSWNKNSPSLQLQLCLYGYLRPFSASGALRLGKTQTLLLRTSQAILAMFERLWSCRNVTEREAQWAGVACHPCVLFFHVVSWIVLE